MEYQKLRMLLVDDNVSIHEDFKACLGSGLGVSADSETTALEKKLFGEIGGNENSESWQFSKEYIIEDAYQGLEAVDMVDKAAMEGNPYGLIFMDVRMPPGIDGIQAIKKIWDRHPFIEIVICTAFSDYSWDKIICELGFKDNLLFTKKPFDPVAVRQTTVSLLRKWQLAEKNRAYMDTLEREVEKRTKALSEMLEKMKQLKYEAEQESFYKSRFLSMMSHELRTPLNGIVGMSELLLDTDLDGEQKDIASTIKTSGNSLHHIINDILDYSKLEEGKVELESIQFNPRAIIENVAELISVVAAKKSLEVASLIQSDVPRMVKGDPERLRQILLNLANNAVKFTEKGDVSIKVHVLDDTRPDSVTLEFSVVDTGIGLSDENMSKLFTAFEQGDTSTNRKYGGTGLGLSICKRLSELMGGNIRAQSQLNQGSAFIFSAVFQSVPQDLSDWRQNPKKPESLRGIHCLIVGDNPVSQKVIELYIKNWQGECTVLRSLSEAKRILNSEDPNLAIDIIIVDYKKGELSDYEVAANGLLQAGNMYKVAPMLCLLPQNKVSKTEAIKNMGYRGYLMRPIKEIHFYNCILMLYGLNAEKHVADMPVLTPYYLDEVCSDKYKVLIAEDNSINQKILATLLSRMGISHDIAENGECAVEACRNKHYDMIFMDCQMPVMDGYEASRLIRQHSGYEKVPIIAVTADTSSENQMHCKQSGMDDFITKPFHMEKMASLIQSHLSNNLQ